MAYKDFDGLSLSGENNHQTIVQDEGQRSVDLPDASYVRDAQITRDGMDLILDGPNGDIVIKDYFGDENAPNLVAPDGSVLTPDLVHSFVTSPGVYADNPTMTDESPVGAVQEVTGHATVTHTDGTTETITQGTRIYQGDIVETDDHGAVNIAFIDETNFAVSEDARLAIDEYVFDPSTQSGSTNFSVLKGMFVFTSGLIGRDDPDDVNITTPVGSIGIRGTIIAGNVDTGEITVVEGAIVLRDHSGHEMTLADQFETARFNGNTIDHVGQLSAEDVGQKFFVVSQVSPTLFSSINDAAAEQGQQPADASQDGTAEDQPATDDNNVAPQDQQDAPDGTQGSDATNVAPDMPPVPPPVPPSTMTGLSTTTGFESSTQQISGSSTNTSHQTAAPPPPPPVQFLGTDTVSAGSTATLPPPPPPQDPSTFNNTSGSGSNGGTTVVNHAPAHYYVAPVEYFKSAEGINWNYHFNKDFKDPDSGLTGVTYQLSATTINMLNTWQTNNIITGWTFTASDGNLMMGINNTIPSTPGTTSTLTIQVGATDSAGLSSGFHDYDFVVYNPITNGTIATNYIIDNSTVKTTTTVTNILGDNNTIFFGAENNNGIVIDNQSGGNLGSGNYLNLGNGSNSVTIMNDAYNNTIVGGNNADTFMIQNAKVRAFGMDGDDKFILDLTNGPNIVSELQTAGSNTLIDGGHSNFRAGQILHDNYGLNHTGGGFGGRGDTLMINGPTSGVLDFSSFNAGNKITGIERVDLVTSTAVQQIRLNYDDVLELTDGKKTLLFNVGSGDVLNLAGAQFNTSNMTKVLDNVAIEDGVEGGTSEIRSYDVFTDGNVTLLIHADAGATVTMDGTNVAI